MIKCNSRLKMEKIDHIPDAQHYSKMGFLNHSDEIVEIADLVRTTVVCSRE